jgi:hypothetical protein
MNDSWRIVLVMFAVSVPAVASAQTRFEFAPALGMYFPARSSHPVEGGLLRQVPAAAVSMQLGYWANANLGLEATVAFSPSFVAYETAERIRDIHSAVTMAGARAVWRTSDVRVGAGFGLVNGVLAPQVAFALRVPLTTTVAVDFQIQDFVRHPRHDMIWGLGFVIPL